MPAIGRCEVVCFTADHDTVVRRPAARAGAHGAARLDRTHRRRSSALPGVEQVFCFENRGREIGVTLAHPHGQIYGYPVRHPAHRRRCSRPPRPLPRPHRRRLLDDLLAAEEADGSRVVRRTAHWTAFVPFAARWPYEVHLHPHRTRPRPAGADDDERADFAAIYLDLLRRFDALFGDADALHLGMAPGAGARRARDLTRLHLQLFSIRRAADKLKYLAGSESAMDAFVNDIRPEDAAAQLREAR